MKKKALETIRRQMMMIDLLWLCSVLRHENFFFLFPSLMFMSDDVHLQGFDARDDDD
jgi:hypothetical protein